MEIKRILTRAYSWEYFWLCLIVVVTLAMHFSIITQPNELVLDEQHYVKDARYILTNEQTQRPEHPPLAKLFISSGLAAFGDNPWGWRIPSIIMGTIGIILFYFICRRLGMSGRASNIATFIFGFENFNFMLASVAMLDVFFVTLMLAYFLLYLSREYVLAGIFIGLSALAKLYAAMGTPALLIHWLLSRAKPSPWFALTVILAPISFIALMPIFDFAITHQFQNPISRITDMMSLSSSLTFANTTHPSLSRPWEWLLNYIPMAFWYTPHYTGAVSPSVWGFIIPVVLYMIYKAVKGNEAGLFGFAWFFSTFLLWIPISILTNRVSFLFYFYPTIGALCLGLGLGLNQALDWVSSQKRKVKIPVMAGIVIFFLFHIASFIVLTPVFIRS
ncbi:MAG: glycosyltransferase family 39 protein [Dehalococcoidales bacterium]|nr:glycosyltransferase family 39 protein [Dehalococcoidales bacterium]